MIEHHMIKQGKKYSDINEPQENLQQLLLDEISNDQSASFEQRNLEQGNFDTKGIDVYRRNLLANANRALSITFPTIFALLDSDVSEKLVYQFLQSSPPTQGDWSQWGDNFFRFLDSTEVVDNYPYLCGCAEVDWAVHCALNGIDQTLKQTSLQVLSESDPEHIFVEFNTNVKIISTVYPLADIFQAHHHSDEFQRETAMNDAKKALASSLKEQTVMVYRPEFQPMVSLLTISEGIFTRSLLDGKSLEQAFDAVKADNEFSFEQWLVTAIKRNLIYYFKER